MHLTSIGAGLHRRLRQLPPLQGVQDHAPELLHRGLRRHFGRRSVHPGAQGDQAGAVETRSVRDQQLLLLLEVHLVDLLAAWKVSGMIFK